VGWEKVASPTLFQFFWGDAIFLLPVSPLQPPRRPFLPFFARTAQHSVLDGTNGLSSFKPCAYCRIVRRADIFAIAQLYVSAVSFTVSFMRFAVVDDVPATHCC